MYYKENWINGYGSGISGPTTPSIAGPTVREAIAKKEYTAGHTDEFPEVWHTVVSNSKKETIAIIPGDKVVREANAKKIAAVPDMIEALHFAKRVLSGDCPLIVYPKDRKGNPKKNITQKEANKAMYDYIEKLLDSLNS